MKYGQPAPRESTSGGHAGAHIVSPAGGGEGASEGFSRAGSAASGGDFSRVTSTGSEGIKRGRRRSSVVLFAAGDEKADLEGRGRGGVKVLGEVELLDPIK